MEYLNSLVELNKSNEKYSELSGLYLKIAKTYEDLAESNGNLELFNKSILNYNNYLGYLDSENGQVEIANANKNIGLLTWKKYKLSNNKEELSDSLEKLIDAREIFTQINNDSKVAETEKDLINIYLDCAELSEENKELNETVNYYENALKLLSVENDRSKFNELKIKNAKIYIKIAKNSDDYNIYFKAIDSLNSVKDENDDINYIVSRNLAQIYEDLYYLRENDDHLESSIKNYNQSLKYLNSNEIEKIKEINLKIEELNKIKTPSIPDDVQDEKFETNLI